MTAWWGQAVAVGTARVRKIHQNHIHAAAPNAGQSGGHIRNPAQSEQGGLIA